MGANKLALAREFCTKEEDKEGIPFWLKEGG